MGESGPEDTGRISNFLTSPVATLVREAAKRGERFDKYFLTRQHEYFLLAGSRCRCGGTCSGCAMTGAIALELSELLPGETEATATQRERAREFIRVEERERGIEMAKIRQRSETMKAKRDGVSAPAAVRAESLRRNWADTERE